MTVAFTWNGLRALGVDEGSLATFPEEFKQGMVARAEMLGDTGENHPDNWVGGLASPDLHAIAILFARDAAERGRCQTEHDKLVAQCEGVEVLSDAGPRGDAAIRLCARPFRLPRPALAAGHRRHWRSADARLRRAAQAGRIHPRVPGRRRTARQSAATRNSFPQRQLHGLSPPAGACGQVSRFPARARQDTRRTGVDRSEAHGALAQRRTTHAGTRERRSGIGRRPAAQQRFQLQGDGSAWLCGTARLAHAAHESPRHGSEHEPTPHDPPRRHLRAAFAGETHRKTASNAASLPS